ncbi:MAG: T9SS type A sorting domain-containing protein [Bacteroidales bacterium]|nr:T9SS type A sorting domain-containing protein [Bacteroidales bacterium]
MKSVLLATLLFFSVLTVNSQVKILFDATKAETANNADWIIDADTWNLGYYPYAAIGGNESNPQMIPTPSQSGITSTSQENYWAGALSAWAVDAVQLGYYVETLPYDGSITYGNSSNDQDLSNYKIFIVCEPNILFTDNEKIAIMNFVQNGGGLFMISDHDNSDRNGDGYDSPYIWNDFLENNPVQSNPFGISFDYQYFTETTYNTADLPNDSLLHGDYGDVTRVEFYGGTSMTLWPSQNSNIKGVVYRNGYSNTGNYGAMCAYTTYGQGRVVALGDSSPADDGSGDNNDNLYDGWIEDANGNHERLIINATIWLASQQTAAITNSNQTNDFKIYSSNNICKFIYRNNSINYYDIIFYDVMGRIIFENKNIQVNEQQVINCEGSGVYLYKITTTKGATKTGKIIL